MYKLVYPLILVFIVGVIISTGCKDESDNNDNPPVTPKNYAWAVGAPDSTDYGMILFSEDWGNTWNRQGEGYSGIKGINLNDVWVVDEKNIWIVGSENTIIRSTNGGQDWMKVNAPPATGNVPELLSISIANKNSIWISGSFGTVYSTVNEGATWATYDNNFFYNGLMQGICAVNSQNIYVVGGVEYTDDKEDMTGFIARTFNAGLTWDSVTLDNGYNRNEWIGCSNAGPDNIVVYGGKTHYTVSDNSGASWHNDSVPVSGGGGGADINCLKMIDGNTWWAAMDLDHVIITLNGGISWTDQGSAGTPNIFLVGIDYFDNLRAIVVGQNAGWPPAGKIIVTSNGGDLWESTLEIDSPLYKVSFIKK